MKANSPLRSGKLWSKNAGRFIVCFCFLIFVSIPYKSKKRGFLFPSHVTVLYLCIDDILHTTVSTSTIKQYATGSEQKSGIMPPKRHPPIVIKLTAAALPVAGQVYRSSYTLHSSSLFNPSTSVFHHVRMSVM